MQKQATRQNQAITLKGSTAIVTEFMEYSVNSILYQRGIYPADEFRAVKKYGLQMLMTSNESLKDYIKTIMAQISEWLLTSSITRIVLAIKSLETDETLERWQFDIHTEDKEQAGTGSASSSSAVPPLPGGPKPAKKKEKTEKDVQAEIREIMKQITASTTFLPILDEECTFNILAYTNNEIEVPASWGDADAHLIDRGQVEQVRLRSFSTNVHSLEAMVAYRVGE